MNPRSRLEELFGAAIAAADPYAATRDALTEPLLNRDDESRAWIIAVGKASARMANAALDAANTAGLEVAGGLVVAPDATQVDPPLESIIGHHPIPGARSLHAATRLGALVHAVLPSDHVLLLVSGGTSSLIAAPADGVDAAELDALLHTLLGAGGGVDIRAMNAVRRRFLRWGGGRLAAAVAPAHLHQVLLSDVIGNDPGVIGSGPAVPDDARARDVLELLDTLRIASQVGPALIAYLHDVARGVHPETPKLGDPVFANISPAFVIGREQMHAGFAAATRDHGVEVTMHDEPIAGEASERGAGLARWLALEGRTGLHFWSGETTVTLGGAHGMGGRSQEFALAAALALESLGAAAKHVTLLAAGTDGRDGPTDAAGAIVDATMAALIRSHGLSPEQLLHRHDSHRALDAAGALLRTGPTGTNVADVVIALVA